ncbi:DUF6048 family protein [Salegentibacter salarius]|uniref:Outer membrane protein beta-barrel domain-containing protein n=1 Tax=Salegentibacter salarius TaxID=435906 RepID=A0A2N0U1D2_9FLAO|nr:DUF6048 family protein [Salegentibacter salarius]OEY73637.1 hypothetical protein BHS39_08440 [Salegentibacter salarius]PKD20807.1 hypothetical protein APR40_08435 [Salegentibacter salarius]SLJ95127.1 hypothetical protein SAMN05660445_01670 [Salegentibacter salarius]
MKHKHISTYFFSLAFLFLASPLLSQETIVQDSLAKREKFGLRIGTDLSKLARTAFEDDYSGFEILGDYRVYKNYYAAAELGNESMGYEEDNISLTSRGSYIKLGADYNAYENWTGMQNLIFVGARYGFATFTQEVDEYRIYTTNSYFEPDVRTDNIEYSGLTASWVELIAGIKVEVLNNLYLSVNVQLKRRLFQSAPDNFDNLTIPGFNRTYDDSNIGVGYGYTISYLIPFYKK